MVTVGIYGDNVPGFDNVDSLVAYLKNKGLKVTDVSGDIDSGWEMNVTGTPKDLFFTICSKIPGYNSKSIQSFIDEYAINESNKKGVTKVKNKVRKIVNNLLSGRSVNESFALCESNESDDKVTALLQFLDLSNTQANRERIDISAYNSNVYFIDDSRNDFLICTDDEADDEHREAIDNFLDDLGIDGFTSHARDYILENCCDTGPIIDYYQDDIRSYAEDIETESNSPVTITVSDDNGDPVDIQVTNRLFQELLDADQIDEKDFTVNDFDESGDYIGDEDLVDIYCEDRTSPEDEGYDSPYEWLSMEFGKDFASKFVADHCSLDVDAVSEYVISEDGRGPELNDWDGEEYEETVNGTTYFIYPRCDFESLDLEDVQDDTENLDTGEE